MMRLAAVMFAAFGVAGCSGCSRSEKTPGDLPPLAETKAPGAMPVRGFGDAVVSAPSGVTRATPVVIAVLGIGDTPEEQCSVWRTIVDSKAFVLCPRGQPNMVQEQEEEPKAGEKDDEEGQDEEVPSSAPSAARAPKQVGFYPPDVPSVDREIGADLLALRARFGAHVAERPFVYVGFSRGAFLGASIAAKRPDLFPRVVLVEGGHSPWDEDSAATFARGGGKRVLFVCGRPSCVDDAEPAAAVLRRQKVETRVVHAVGEGHGYKRQVKEELTRSFRWVIEDDPRF